MNKNGIGSNKTNKRDAGAFLLFVFLLPYVCACLWGHVGEETGKLKEETQQAEETYRVEADVEWGVWELPMEEYLTYRLLLTMPDSCHLEAKKAQAVLLRTELAVLYRGQEDKTIRVEDEGLGRFYMDSGSDMSGEKGEALQESRQAVKATEGQILTYRGEPIRASYFKLSNGFTRSAAENGEDDCPYLTKVVCEQDRTSPEYHSLVRVDRAAYIKGLLEVLKGDYEEESIWEEGEFTFDDSGYMINASYIDKNGKKEVVDGETFRHLFRLNAASFTMSREEASVIFYVTGIGHGFGMSQFEADARAENGESYQEILADFFFQTELAKFE